MVYIYQKAADRVKELRFMTTDKMTTNLLVNHRDGSWFYWESCYFEYLDMPTGEKVVIIEPEHHPGVFYDLEDLTLFEVYKR